MAVVITGSGIDTPAGGLDAADLTGTLPALDGSALTGITPTTAQVLTATAGASVGTVGTYAMLWLSGGTTHDQGFTISGSSLRYSNAATNNTNSVDGASTLAPSGTWMLMGNTGYIDGASFVGDRQGICIWLRIA